MGTVQKHVGRALSERVATAWKDKSEGDHQAKDEAPLIAMKDPKPDPKPKPKPLPPQPRDPMGS